MAKLVLKHQYGYTILAYLEDKDMEQLFSAFLLDTCHKPDHIINNLSNIIDPKAEERLNLRSPYYDISETIELSTNINSLYEKNI